MKKLLLLIHMLLVFKAQAQVKTYCYLDQATIPQYVLDAKIDGVSYVVPAANLFGINGAFNDSYFTGLRATIKKVGAAGKEMTLSIQFGSACGNAIFNNYPTILFTQKSHQNPNNPDVPLKEPIPYDDGYLIKISEMVQWFAAKLKEDPSTYAVVKNITITGMNELTRELRMTAADFTGTNTLTVAYIQGANKWLTADYTCKKVTDAAQKIIYVFDRSFPDKELVQPFIPKLNGFPCIDKEGKICDAKARPDLSDEIIRFGIDLSPKVNPMFTAFTETAVVPGYCTFLQLNRSKVGHGELSLANYLKLLDKAKSYKVLEIFADNITAYPEVYKR